jgi:hypothetical protein
MTNVMKPVTHRRPKVWAKSYMTAPKYDPLKSVTPVSRSAIPIIRASVIEISMLVYEESF